MFFIWKGKGILIIPYLFLSTLVIAIAAVLSENIFKFIFVKGINIFIIFGLSLIVTGILTSATSIDYIEERGKKKIYNDRHSFFFIKMKYWKYIFYISGISCLIFDFIHLLISQLV